MAYRDFRLDDLIGHADIVIEIGGPEMDILRQTDNALRARAGNPVAGRIPRLRVVLDISVLDENVERRVVHGQIVFMRPDDVECRLRLSRRVRQKQKDGEGDAARYADCAGPRQLSP